MRRDGVPTFHPANLHFALERRKAHIRDDYGPVAPDRVKTSCRCGWIRMDVPSSPSPDHAIPQGVAAPYQYPTR
jgi:hypothetical protein